jgi:hypothetical protein
MSADGTRERGDFSIPRASATNGPMSAPRARMLRPLPTVWTEHRQSGISPEDGVPPLELLTQLGSGASTAGNDCAVITALNSIRWASDGKVGPRNHGELKDWVRAYREWAGVSENRGLLFKAETFAGYRHHELQKRFADAHLPPMQVEYVARVGWGTLIRRIQAGQFCHLAVNYGVLRANHHAPTGSTMFSDGHSIGLFGAHEVQGRLHVFDGDPLFDGRRAGIPDGWQDARLYNFRKAAGNWGRFPAGVGHAYAIFIRKG